MNWIETIETMDQTVFSVSMGTPVMQENYRRCCTCHQMKNLSEFPKNKNQKFGVHVQCKICNRVQTKKYHHKNKQRHTETTYIPPNSSYCSHCKEHLPSLFFGYNLCSKNGLYNLCKYHEMLKQLKRRKLCSENLISKDRYFFIVTQKCFYCGSTDRINIDRIDNTKSYIEGNCRPCCKTCNRMKGTLTHDEFVSQTFKISKHMFNEHIFVPESNLEPSEIEHDIENLSDAFSS